MLSASWSMNATVSVDERSQSHQSATRRPVSRRTEALQDLVRSNVIASNKKEKNTSN